MNNDKPAHTGRVQLLLALLLTVTVQQTHFAEGWRARLVLSGGRANIDDITDKGTIGTGEVIGGQIDGQIQESDFDDTAAGFGANVAYNWGAWAVEGELIWRYRTNWDLTIPTPEIRTITNVFSNVETTTALVNVIREGSFGSNSKWRWHAGAGVGVVYNDVEADYIERAVPGETPEFKVKDSNSETDVTWNVLAGVDRPFGNSWTFRIRYRYIDLGDLEVGPFPDRSGVVYGEHTSHELLFGLHRQL